MAAEKKLRDAAAAVEYVEAALSSLQQTVLGYMGPAWVNVFLMKWK